MLNTKAQKKVHFIPGIPEDHHVIVEIENLSEKSQNLRNRIDVLERKQKNDRSKLHRLIVLFAVFLIFFVDYWIIIFYNNSYARVISGLPKPYQPPPSTTTDMSKFIKE